MFENPDDDVLEAQRMHVARKCRAITFCKRFPKRCCRIYEGVSVAAGTCMRTVPKEPHSHGSSSVTSSARGREPLAGIIWQ